MSDDEPVEDEIERILCSILKHQSSRIITSLDLRTDEADIGLASLKTWSSRMILTKKKNLSAR